MTVYPTLPPVPDLRGEPRPPAGPAVAGRVATLPEVRVRRFPEGRNVKGDEVGVGSDAACPLLERVSTTGRPTRPRTALAVGAVAAVLTSLGFGVYFVITDGAHFVGFAAVLVALLFAGAAAGTYFSGPSLIVDVGAMGIATRMAYNEGPGPVVDLYALASVSVRERDGSLELELTRPDQDRSGVSAVGIPCGVLEAAPDAWALVYNGIRHSEAAGALIDDRTRELLQLPAAGG